MKEDTSEEDVDSEVEEFEAEAESEEDIDELVAVEKMPAPATATAIAMASNPHDTQANYQTHSVHPPSPIRHGNQGHAPFPSRDPNIRASRRVARLGRFGATRVCVQAHVVAFAAYEARRAGEHDSSYFHHDARRLRPTCAFGL
ncbi:unnamed protein product [Peniophora sp. CBMAI 1063]|nr:unnamed protein product [Peniophora sp. CBMAI 1063]